MILSKATEKILLIVNLTSNFAGGGRRLFTFIHHVYAVLASPAVLGSREAGEAARAEA